jgi:hypothetical protein
MIQINTGIAFEKAIEDVFRFLYQKYPNAKVERNVYLDSPYGKRQIDVLITMQIPDSELRIVVEGKDNSRKLSIKQVDEYHSKLLDVHASKGILISKLGFSQAAKLKAKALNIDLYTLKDSLDIHDLKIVVPFLIEEVMPLFIDLKYEINRDQFEKIPGGVISLNNSFVVNGLDIIKFLEVGWKNDLISYDMTESPQIITFPAIHKPYILKYFVDKNKFISNTIELDSFTVTLTIKIRYFIADIKELLYSKVLENIGLEKITFFIDTKTIKKALNTLTPVTLNFAKEFPGVKYKIKVKGAATMKIKNHRILEYKTSNAINYRG